MIFKKKIKIGAQTVKVIETMGNIMKDDEPCSGLSHPMKNALFMMTIDDDGEEVQESLQADIYLHEIIHFISTNYGLNLNEGQVIGLTGGLLAVIRDNKLDFRK